MPKGETIGKLPQIDKQFRSDIEDWSGEDKNAVAEITVARMVAEHGNPDIGSEQLRSCFLDVLNVGKDLRISKAVGESVRFQDDTTATPVEMLLPIVKEFDGEKEKQDKEFAGRNFFFILGNKFASLLSKVEKQHRERVESAIKDFLAETPPGSIPLKRGGVAERPILTLTIDVPADPNNPLRKRLAKLYDAVWSAIGKDITKIYGNNTQSFVQQLAIFDSGTRQKLAERWKNEQLKKLNKTARKTAAPFSGGDVTETEPEDAEATYNSLMNLSNKDLKERLEAMSEEEVDAMLAQFTEEQQETFFDRVDTL